MAQSSPPSLVRPHPACRALAALLCRLRGITLAPILIATLADAAAPRESHHAPVATGAQTSMPLGSAVFDHGAVGRLLIPAIRYVNGYARHYDEQCSASVVTIEAGRPSRHILSAWHCLEDYRDLSRPVIFERPDRSRYIARLIASGRSMDRDWALLALPSAVAPGLLLGRSAADGDGSLSLAGFPRDAGRDASLTVLNDCPVIGFDQRDKRTACVLQQGASGGPVVASGEPAARFVGVISRGDGETQSIFVPVDRFYAQVRAILTGAL